jgi:transcriptional regulator with PAS, ATPase and Fis domain
MATTETLVDDTGAPAAPGPYLVLALECARLGAGSARYSLAGIDEIRIGRGTERAARRRARTLVVEVPDGSMSTEHARIVRDGAAGWIVEDAGSKNGTYVNGVRHTRHELGDGDVIDTAQAIFVIRTGAGSADAGDHELAVQGASDLATLDPQLAATFGTLGRVAKADVPLLVLGETGTGKEVVARAAHALSGRSGNYVAVNCGAIAPTLVMSELFGYRRGAFSGATEDRPGFVRAADRGTLFLDEIAELAPESQAALLRVLQEREVIPVGGTAPVKVDLHVVSATCQDIAALVELGEFRRDLHARIAGFTLTLPPLRGRRVDLGHLVARLIARRGATCKLHRAAARALFLYRWPHNIRELDQVLAAALAVGDGEIALAQLPPHVSSGEPAPRSVAGNGDADVLPPKLDRDALVALFETHRGNVSHVARALGTSRSQVRRMASRFGLDVEPFRRG